MVAHLAYFICSIWFGTTAYIAVIAVISFFDLSETDLLIIAPLIPELYQKIILSVGIFTLLQGFIYGFFTNWGFFKHGWLLLKWVFTVLLMLCIGVGTISQMCSVIDKVNTADFTGGVSDGSAVLLFISLQILIMLIMIGVSVFKPKMNREKAEKCTSF